MATDKDYGYTAVTGATYLRFARVVINNPLNQTPVIVGVRERVFNVEGGQTVLDDGVIEFAFDPAFEFDLRDPVTNEPTGERMTMGKLYAAISGCLQDQAKGVNNA